MICQICTFQRHATSVVGSFLWPKLNTCVMAQLKRFLVHITAELSHKPHKMLGLNYTPKGNHPMQLGVLSNAYCTCMLRVQS